MNPTFKVGDAVKTERVVHIEEGFSRYRYVATIYGGPKKPASRVPSGHIGVVLKVLRGAVCIEDRYLVSLDAIDLNVKGNDPSCAIFWGSCLSLASPLEALGGQGN